MLPLLQDSSTLTQQTPMKQTESSRTNIHVTDTRNRKKGASDGKICEDFKRAAHRHTSLGLGNHSGTEHEVHSAGLCRKLASGSASFWPSGSASSQEHTVGATARICQLSAGLLSFPGEGLILARKRGQSEPSLSSGG